MVTIYRYDGITVTTPWKTYLFGIQIVEEYILSPRNNLLVENNIIILLYKFFSKFIDMNINKCKKVSISLLLTMSYNDNMTI